eukprot:52547-Rhodomonas_salina.1
MVTKAAFQCPPYNVPTNSASLKEKVNVQGASAKHVLHSTQGCMQLAGAMAWMGSAFKTKTSQYNLVDTTQEV